jgi:hypothetical protein
MTLKNTFFIGIALGVAAIAFDHLLISGGLY